MLKRNWMWIALIALIAVAAPAVQPLTAQDNANAVPPKNLEEYSDRAMEAAEVLTQVMGVPETKIPDELMSRARGIAVIPGVIKGAFGLGGRYGKGLISQRMANGNWSTPAFVEIGGGSFGFQIGVESTDLVLVFTNDDGIKSLLDGKVTMSVDASVAAGPVGRQASASTDVTLDSEIYAYSRSKGLFAGVALDGAALTIDDSANRKVYGVSDGKAILLGGTVKSNAVTQPFVDALGKYSPRMTKSTRS